jgi:DNA-binding response OmpR family regulator
MAKKILIAEDEVDLAMMIACRLKANKYEVSIATDGLQAITKAHREKPDLILLDIMMPCGGGIGVLENLKKSVETFMIPIIVLTGSQDKNVRKKAMDLGVADYMTKPFSSDELVAKITKLLGSE